MDFERALFPQLSNKVNFNVATLFLWSIQNPDSHQG